MKFVDRTKLECELIKSGMTKADLAEELSLSYSGVYNKLKGYREFTENEIFTLGSLFGPTIFFLDNSVSNLRTKYDRRNRKKN